MKVLSQGRYLYSPVGGGVSLELTERVDGLAGSAALLRDFHA